MQLIKTGATRHVILWRNYAIKYPNPHSWRTFLQGVLANEQERTWSEFLMGKTWKFAPVLWSSWGCFVIVMRRCRPVTRKDYTAGRMPKLMSKYVQIDDNLSIPCELKEDSFGWLDGNLVCLDYGS